MAPLRLCFTVLLASGWLIAANPPAGPNSGDPGADSGPAAKTNPHPAVAPVLLETEPPDSLVVRLPGPRRTPPAAPPSPPAQPAPPVQTVAKAVVPPVRLDPPPPPGALDDPGPPHLRRAPRPVYPPEFEKDSALYCQRLIGRWTMEDAAMLLGDAKGSRPAFDDHQKENGTIYAFADPTSHYRQIELDFDAGSGTLRTVFGYPWDLTWQECRRLWGVNVSAAEANKGRRFYSYLNRHLDVLVDKSGKVISLGLY